MKFCWLLIVTYATFLVQTSFAPILEIAGTRANFVVMGMLLVVPCLPSRLVVITAATWGLISDALSPAGLGIDVICFAIAAFVLWHLQRRGICQTVLARCLFLFPSAIALIGVSSVLREISMGATAQPMQVVSESMTTGIYTASLGCLFLLWAAWRARGRGDSFLVPDVRNRWTMLTQ